MAGDVTDSEYLKRLVQKAAEFGNGKIHIIVNNAGYTWDGVIHKVGGNCTPDIFMGVCTHDELWDKYGIIWRHPTTLTTFITAQR